MPADPRIRRHARRPWWKSAVIYQIYPRSFADTNGDGVGDLEGHPRASSTHLTWLGVDAIWLSPFFRSPMADFGYDVSDYCDVDPLFGTLDDFDRLVAEAHERGLRVLLDWVPNHTSDQHPWFVESRSVADEPEARLVRLARPARRTAAAQQLDRRVRATGRRRGPSTTPPASGTCTSSCPSSPTSTGRNPERRGRPCTTCCGSGSTAASTASAWTSIHAIGKRRRAARRPAGDVGGRHARMRR